MNKRIWKSHITLSIYGNNYLTIGCNLMTFLYDMILETFKLDMYTRHNNDKQITRMVVYVFTILICCLYLCALTRKKYNNTMQRSNYEIKGTK